MSPETDGPSTELQKHRQQSLKALRVHAFFFMLALLLAWMLHAPFWIFSVVVCLTLFMVIGDMVSYLYCSQKLRNPHDDHS